MHDVDQDAMHHVDREAASEMQGTAGGSIRGSLHGRADILGRLARAGSICDRDLYLLKTPKTGL